MFFGINVRCLLDFDTPAVSVILFFVFDGDKLKYKKTRTLKKKGKK